MVLLYSLFKVLSYPFSVKASLGHGCSKVCLHILEVFKLLVTLAIGLVFGAGSTTVFFNFQPEYEAGPLGTEAFCGKEIYWFAFVTSVLIWVVIAIGALIAAINCLFFICFGRSKE